MKTTKKQHLKTYPIKGIFQEEILDEAKGIMEKSIYE